MLSIVRDLTVRVMFVSLICASPVWIASASADEPTKPDSATSDPAAQTEEVIQTEEVVVSATKTPVPVSQVTSAVEVITEQDMKKQNLRTVAQALRLAQGVAAFQSGGPGTEVNARIRGASSSQTLVLIDGAIVATWSRRGAKGHFPPRPFWNMVPSHRFAKAARSPEKRVSSITVFHSPAGIRLAFQL